MQFTLKPLTRRFIIIRNNTILMDGTEKRNDEEKHNMINDGRMWGLSSIPEEGF